MRSSHSGVFCPTQGNGLCIDNRGAKKRDARWLVLLALTARYLDDADGYVRIFDFEREPVRNDNVGVAKYASFFSLGGVDDEFSRNVERVADARNEVLEATNDSSSFQGEVLFLVDVGERNAQDSSFRKSEKVDRDDVFRSAPDLDLSDRDQFRRFVVDVELVQNVLDRYVLLAHLRVQFFAIAGDQNLFRITV